jgi:hypothetical protein
MYIGRRYVACVTYLNLCNLTSQVWVQVQLTELHEALIWLHCIISSSFLFPPPPSLIHSLSHSHMHMHRHSHIGAHISILILFLSQRMHTCVRTVQCEPIFTRALQKSAMARTRLIEILLISAGSITAEPKSFILCPANESGDNKTKLWNI